MIYHCPECGSSKVKESFGYPTCCGRTMNQGPAPRPTTVQMQGRDGTYEARPTVRRLWEMALELDEYCRDNDVTDWELDFIADMAGKAIKKEVFVGKQGAIVLRLWEKYCA